MLTSAADVHFLLQMRDARVVSYCSWRKVAGDVGAFAGDGVGKWAAVRGPAHWNVCLYQCLFSVTRPIGVECKMNSPQKTKRNGLNGRALSNAVSYR